MTTTKPYTVSELGLMRLEDALKHIAINGLHDPYEVGELCKNVRRGFTGITIPVKAYAVSVVERFAENIKYLTFDRIINARYNPYTKHIILEGVGIGEKDNQSFAFYCPTNPFDGLLNDDGTPVTSVTKETLEAWKREVVG